jgi:hypothetical protein
MFLQAFVTENEITPKVGFTYKNRCTFALFAQMCNKFPKAPLNLDPFMEGFASNAKVDLYLWEC